MIIFWKTPGGTGGTCDYPLVSKVEIGTVYANGAKTGTYTGADRWTDPGVSNVRRGVSYLANAIVKTGTLLVHPPCLGELIGFVQSNNGVSGFVKNNNIVSGFVSDSAVTGVIQC